jgi:nitronate monooxygenase
MNNSPTTEALPGSLPTAFTKMLNIRYPIIGAPMFLVSNVSMVTEVSEAGGIGTFPALNYRPVEAYEKALTEIKQRTEKPVGVNIIVNQSNTRQGEDLRLALKAGVELFITSLGNPKTVIQEAHRQGAKVICDVTNLEHAMKVQDLGADGVIAVSTGAGGHAGPITPMVLIPWLKKRLSIPVIAAGGIADGRGLLAALALGADGVSIGTRFIASKEASVAEDYKRAILESDPEDIVLSTRISGTPASVINTEYVKKLGLKLPWYLEALKKNPTTKKWATLFVHWKGSKDLEVAAQADKPTWKTVWSAGQSVGLIDEELSCRQIIESIVSDYTLAQATLPGGPLASPSHS